VKRTKHRFPDLKTGIEDVRKRSEEVWGFKLAFVDGEIPAGGHIFDMSMPDPPSGGGVNIKGPVPKYSQSQINDILEHLRGSGFKNNPLRQAYENEVLNLAKRGEELLSQGMPKEEVARILHQIRRDLGVKDKDATPQPLRDYIYEINQTRYGDPLGPSFEHMMKTGKDFDQIIESATRPNENIDKLLSGFEQWLKEQHS
jgi:hypothetical protein